MTHDMSATIQSWQINWKYHHLDDKVKFIKRLKYILQPRSALSVLKQSPICTNVFITHAVVKTQFFFYFGRINSVNVLFKNFRNGRFWTFLTNTNYILPCHNWTVLRVKVNTCNGIHRFPKKLRLCGLELLTGSRLASDSTFIDLL